MKIWDLLSFKKNLSRLKKIILVSKIFFANFFKGYYTIFWNNTSFLFYKKFVNKL
jgi:hypothetical protein